MLFALHCALQMASVKLRVKALRPVLIFTLPQKRLAVMVAFQKNSEYTPAGTVKFSGVPQALLCHHFFYLQLLRAPKRLAGAADWDNWAPECSAK